MPPNNQSRGRLEAYRFGAERPVLSKMMGHAKEETTKHYYDVNIPEIVEGTRKIDFEKIGI